MQSTAILSIYDRRGPDWYYECVMRLNEAKPFVPDSAIWEGFRKHGIEELRPLSQAQGAERSTMGLTDCAATLAIRTAL